jgi:REP element-mobilizing transposase RayT
MIQYKRNLPHLHPPDQVFHIVFRLADSLPEHVVEQLRQEYAYHLKLADKLPTAEQRMTHKKQAVDQHFDKMDKILNTAKHGPRWPQDPSLARIVMNKIREFDQHRYILIVCSIMPNHVHLLCDTQSPDDSTVLQHKGKTQGYPLADTLRLLKGNTSRFCNKILQRNGAFWCHESYDHCVRDNDELTRAVEYILYNPVKAGLVSEWQQWDFTYLNTAYFETPQDTPGFHYASNLSTT